MLHPSTKRLIDRLSEMTGQRKIDWLETDRPDAYVYDTDGYRVILDGKPAALLLCDALGNELDRADPDELAATKHIDGGSYTEIVEAMRKDASRIAKGTENAIAAVLGGLDLDGDGIPDVPAPVELEAAPEGDVGQALDNIEDTVNEAEAIDVAEMDVLDQVDGLQGTAADMTEAVENGLDISDMPNDLGGGEALVERVVDIDDLAVPDIPGLQEIAAEAESMADAAVPDMDIDAAPDVGKAVADLAEKVNGEQDTLPPATAPETNNDFSLPAASSILTGAGAMGAFGALNSRSQGTIESTPSSRETADAGNSALDIPDVNTTESVDTLADAASAAPEAVKSFSLSGLTETAQDVPIEPRDISVPDAIDAAPLEDIQAEPVRAATIVTDIAEPSEAEASAQIGEQISDLTEQITAQPEAMDAIAETSETDSAEAFEAELETQLTDMAPDPENIQAPDAPEAPSEEVVEEEPAKKPTPKRFNPWI